MGPLKQPLGVIQYLHGRRGFFTRGFCSLIIELWRRLKEQNVAPASFAINHFRLLPRQTASDIDHVLHPLLHLFHHLYYSRSATVPPAISTIFTQYLPLTLLRVSDILQASWHSFNPAFTVTQPPIALYESLHGNPDLLCSPSRERFLVFEFRP